MRSALLLFCLASNAAMAEPVLFLGDSYMQSMSPYLANLWPGSQVTTKIGSGLNSPIWKTYTPDPQYRYAVISLGINDMPSATAIRRGWADGYARKVAAELNRFSPGTTINWILPPCPLGQSRDDSLRLQWLHYAIRSGVALSGRPVRVVSPPAEACMHQTADGVHFQPEGYRIIMRSLLAYR